MLRSEGDHVSQSQSVEMNAVGPFLQESNRLQTAGGRASSRGGQLRAVAKKAGGKHVMSRTSPRVRVEVESRV